MVSSVLLPRRVAGFLERLRVAQQNPSDEYFRSRLERGSVALVKKLKPWRGGEDLKRALAERDAMIAQLRRENALLKGQLRIRRA
eukprot:3284134-Prymnesium_polylepis.1